MLTLNDVAMGVALVRSDPPPPSLITALYFREDVPEGEVLVMKVIEPTPSKEIAGLIRAVLRGGQPPLPTTRTTYQLLTSETTYKSLLAWAYQQVICSSELREGFVWAAILSRTTITK